MSWKQLIKIMCISAGLFFSPSCGMQRTADRSVHNKTFTILALGDSITEGGTDFSSYLFPLDSMLKAAGYIARFIGPRTAVVSGDTIHHAGFSGRTAEYLAAKADSIYANYPADIILLHSGHNHFVEESPVPNITNAQLEIIQKIHAKNNAAIIMLATVITSGKLPKYQYIPALNAAIRNMVSGLHDSRVVLVEQESRWNWPAYTINDKVHPNKIGARIIAENWFNSIVKLLSKKNKAL